MSEGATLTHYAGWLAGCIVDWSLPAVHSGRRLAIVCSDAASPWNNIDTQGRRDDGKLDG